MKPKYIFSAVFAVCFIMVGFLPRLYHAPHVTAAALPVVSTQAPPAAQSVLSAAQGLTAKVANAAPPPRPTATALPKPTLAPIAAPAVAAPPGAKPVAAVPLTAQLPDIAAFAAGLQNGQAAQVVGVYVPGQFALPVVQQPNGNDEFVSTNDQTVTQYARPSDFGVIGLLAHNTLSGQNFFKLKNKQEVVVIYGDGRQARFRITDIQRYQAISPYDAYSDFVDLNGPGAARMNYQQLFQRVYTSASKLVFQTCFEANGDLSWGRIFFIANPM